MPMTATQAQYLIDTYCDGDWERISFICTSQGKPMYFREWLKKPGRGVNFVNTTSGGEKVMGFLLYDYIPQGAMQATMLIENGQRVTKQETFYPIDQIDHFGWYPKTIPDYVTPEQP